LAEFDIVCFQEAFGGIFSETREKIMAYATKAGFLYIVHDDDPGYGSTYISDGGLMILSRFPIVSTAYHPYSYSQDKDGLIQRGALYAKINIQDNKHIHVFTTHTNSTHWMPADVGPMVAKQGLESRKM